MPPSIPAIDNAFPLFGPQRGSVSVVGRRGAAAPGRDPLRALALRQLDEGLRALRRSLTDLERLRELSGRGVARREAVAARAISTEPLSLEAIPTATTLRSSQEVNTAPTSFSPFGPDFQGASTSLPTVGGVYDGALGDTTLLFEVKQSRTVGSNKKLDIQVFDGNDRIATLNFKNVPPGTPVAGPNGITLALGPGDVVKNDTFTVDVFASIPSAVDPSKPFDGVRNEIPNFDPGEAVVAGSFEVNGVTISVAADDDLQTVLQRITDSAAGVTASYDAASDSVILTQKTLGSAANIVVGNDSSGFLSATKLDDAIPVLGQDGDDPLVQPIAEIPELDSVSTGDVVINGVSIAIDIDVDSVGDVLDRINQSAAGVTATLDPETLLLSITSNDPTASMTLSDGSSGFLSAMKVLEGTYQPRTEIRGQGGGRGSADVEEALRSLQRVSRRLDALFEVGFGRPLAELDRSREGIRESLLESFGEFFGEPSGDRLRTGLGLDIDLASGKGPGFDLDVGRLRQTLGRDAEPLFEFLFREAEGSDPAGLVPALVATLDQLQESVALQLGTVGDTGRLIDVRA